MKWNDYETNLERDEGKMQTSGDTFEVTIWWLWNQTIHSITNCNSKTVPILLVYYQPN